MAAALTLDPIEQRLLLLTERGQLIPNGEVTAIVGCGDPRSNQQEEESVFLTPSSSPYSQDGSNYQGEIGFFSTEIAPNLVASMDPGHLHMHNLSPQVSSNAPYMSPPSPCDDYYKSPYSSPYNTSSPNSISCSPSPHGSPCTDSGQFSAYMNPETTIPNLLHPSASSMLPFSACTSVPYNGSLTYTNSVPVSTSGYYSSGPLGGGSMPPQWEGGNGLPNFGCFSSGEHSHMPHHLEGEEVPISIIDQSSVPVPPEMVPAVTFYDKRSPLSSTESHHAAIMAPYCQDLVAMMPPEMGILCPPQQFRPKVTKRKCTKKPKIAIQVNDEHIKDIPTSAQLWEFTLRVLKKPAYHYMVNWENRKEGLFRFHDANAFAALWGKHRNRPHMTYDKVARALRYYYKRDILNQVGGRLTYRFSKRLSKLYATDD